MGRTGVVECGTFEDMTECEEATGCAAQFAVGEENEFDVPSSWIFQHFRHGRHNSFGVGFRLPSRFVVGVVLANLRH